ncbi:MAG: hypothetical protein WAM04_00160, partial [Candidatus Sulfotelmatobacter sp.]
SSRSLDREKRGLRMTVDGRSSWLGNSHLFFASTMIAALVTAMRPAALLVALSFLLCSFAPPLSAWDGGDWPAGAVALSADDFDWRATVPYLFAAAALPGEQGIRTVLEHSDVLRAYVANEVRAECRPDKGRCAAKREGFTMDGEVTKRIDGIIREGMVHQHKSTVVDCPLKQPFPFSEISALRSEKQQDAYLVLQFADRSYTAAQVQAKYGAPDDTDIFQEYSIFKYRLDSPSYRSRAVFEIDPVDGAVMKIAISLKTRSRH